MREEFDLVKILNLRVTFKNAPVQILEKFNFKNIQESYKQFLEIPWVEECVLLQTCNRVEVFLVLSSHHTKETVDKWIKIINGSDSHARFIESSEDRMAMKHLMSLTSGLESLVVGEDQILGQVRRAHEYARTQEYAGSNLSLLFERAIKIGTKIRNESGLNRGSVSVGSVAVNLAEDYLDDLHTKNVLLIGTGEGASLIAKSLNKRHVDFLVASRTYERARVFSQSVGGKPIDFESALSSFHQIDLTFVSTSAPYFLITFARVQTAMTSKTNGMMIFDLSNPRTVEDTVASLPGVKLVNMDQIAEMVDRNLMQRQTGISNAENMLDDEIDFIDNLFRKKQVEPFVVEIFKRVEEVRERELSKAIKLMSVKSGTKEYKILEQLSFAIVEGILSTPMNNFRKEVTSYEKNQEIVKIISRIFNYEQK
jgi:glutamyl-tRNA reductase